LFYGLPQARYSHEQYFLHSSTLCSQVQAMLASPKAYKRFLKRTKCAQCGAKCMDKRFGPISALVVLSMIDSFWCSACGRLLCDKHRSLHTCEKQDFLNAKQRSKTAEQIKVKVFLLQSSIVDENYSSVGWCV